MSTFKINPTIMAEMKKLNLEGHTKAYIANCCGCSTYAVQYYCDGLYEDVQKKRRERDAQKEKKAWQDTEKFKYLISTGMTTAEIAFQEHEKQTYVIRCLKAADVSCRVYSKDLCVYPVIYRWMVSNGIGIKDIASRIGMSCCQVSKVINGHTIDLNENYYLNRRRSGINQVVSGILQLSGLTFQQAFARDVKKSPCIYDKSFNHRHLDCVYPEIEQWVNRNNISSLGLAAAAGCSYGTIKNLFAGKVTLSKNILEGPYSYGKTALAIKKILELSNMTYEKAFNIVP